VKKEVSERFNFPTVWVSEGKVRVLVPRLEAFVEKPSDYAPSRAPVFYNPVMELNRDVAVLVLQVFQRFSNRGLFVCEPLAGCGVRGIRFAVEVDGVEKVVVNDINPRAFGLMRFNIEANGVSGRVFAESKDANLLLSEHAAPRRRFDYVDVDPFGSPVPFLDSALRSVRRGGMVALTSTDLAPLCGVHVNACVRKYGAKPLRTEYCHELALRILVGCLMVTAAKYELGVRVVFSYYAEHYARVYAEIDYGARKADENLRGMGYVYHCFGCLHREFSYGIFGAEKRECPRCGREMDFAGPLWLGELASKEYCEGILRELDVRELKNGKRIGKMVGLILDEIGMAPTFYDVNKVCERVGCLTVSPRRVVEELRARGFSASLTHFKSTGVKTDADISEVMDVVRSLGG